MEALMALVIGVLCGAGCGSCCVSNFQVVMGSRCSRMR